MCVCQFSQIISKYYNLAAAISEICVMYGYIHYTYIHLAVFASNGFIFPYPTAELGMGELALRLLKG